MFAALAQCLREVCDYGSEKGVVIALQNHDNRNLASTGPDVLRIIRDIDHANLSFIMDTGQWRGSPGASGDPDPEVDIYDYMEQTLPHASYTPISSLSSPGIQTYPSPSTTTAARPGSKSLRSRVWLPSSAWRNIRTCR